ncbi:MAG: Nramp family divalent metal transporter, partial [Alphaproteobacteria bacterium]|nr:Nramp family divalent metal transporter [Alphaproteobacteria bacterium]
AFSGPGLMVAVGYMDPGNWATDIEAGSRFGYGLLFVVLFSSLSAIVLQCLCARLGIVAGKDLAQLCNQSYSRPVRIFLWLMAEVSIIACDIAEVLGCALAFTLLFNIPLLLGVALTIFDTAIVLGLKGRNFRTLEAIILGLVVTIGACFLVEIVLIKPFWPDVFAGFLPSRSIALDPAALPLIVGIIGATVMPHNLYLHSSIVQTRVVGKSADAKQAALRLATMDTVVSLLLAMLVNAAILMLAAGAFHAHGNVVTEIQDAYRLLDPVVGTTLGGLLFALALMAAGQSSTFTGTIAGQVILEGFLDLKIPCWQRRIITRGLALVPAFIGVWIFGEAGVGRMLVLTQIVLSLQLPFAVYPLIRFASSRVLMGGLKASLALQAAAWAIFLCILAGNIWLLVDVVF